MHERVLEAVFLGDREEHGLEIQEAVRDVEGDHALRFEVSQVFGEGFNGDEVHGNRVPGEGVHHEHVEALRSLALEGQARVAEDSLDLPVRVLEVREPGVRHLDDRGIDVVEAVGIVGIGIDGQRSGSQPDHADLDGLAAERQYRAADARGGLVIGGRRAPVLLREVLLAVQDRAVDERAVPGVHVVDARLVLLDPQHAVVVALDVQRVLGERVHAVGECREGKTHDRYQHHHDGGRPPEVGDHREHRDHHQRDLELEVAGQGDRRHDAHQDAADHPAQRDDQVEEGQVPGTRAQPCELAVAEHADEVQADGEDGEVPQQLELQALVGEEPCHHAQDPDEASQVGVAPVPDAPLEAQDEREQVDGERDHPEQRDRGDVLGEVVGDAEESHRTHGREREPKHDRARARGGLLGIGGQLPAFDRERGQVAAFPGERGAEHDEEGVTRRPPRRLLRVGEPRLEQERVSEERQHGGEVRQREQPIRARPGIGTREPGLHQRAGRRQQEVGQADGGEKEQQDAHHGIVVAGGFPAGVGHDRQQNEAGDQQRDMDPALLPGRHAAAQPMRVGVAQQQHELEEHHAQRPHDRRPAEPRQDLLGEEGLDEEKEECAEEDCRGVQRHRAIVYCARRCLPTGFDSPCCSSSPPTARSAHGCIMRTAGRFPCSRQLSW